ncbi:MAG TPA: hypothetical protein VIZ65_10700 [Cellvibrionaceae bacterium]
MSSERSNFNWLANIAPALALLAPALYIIGFVYHETFLEGFGLTAGDFPKTTQEYFTFAYYCLFVYAVKLFVWAIVAVPVIVFCLFPFGWLSYQWYKAEDRIVDNLSARWRGRINKENAMKSIENSERIFKFILVILALVVIIILSAFFALQAGQEQAAQQQKNHPGCELATNKTAGCTFLRDNSTVIASGLLVARSSTHLAFYANGKTTTYPLKEYIIESYPKSKDERNQP